METTLSLWGQMYNCIGLHIKHLEQCLVQSKDSVNVRYYFLVLMVQTTWLVIGKVRLRTLVCLIPRYMSYCFQKFLLSQAESLLFWFTWWNTWHVKAPVFYLLLFRHWERSWSPPFRTTSNNFSGKRMIGPTFVRCSPLDQSCGPKVWDHIEF